ncbi:sperm-associated antigen 1-like isoform X1 [Branchiostoma floridae]|uniref:Sperm-associated antigen 1-like isoform X1 n=1 Tax=Branchiostoma floridae TaxID=7739 RepID=A0A9J7HFP8_BRAFL|nr:sperm-associated antigen 1-like isoform X1 [Branchiostoma floridae]
MSSSVGFGQTTKRYNIPIEHLDYKYIEGCENARELEKILYELRSGDEGIYPELISFCEKRLEALKPDSKALRVDLPAKRPYDIDNKEWTEITQDITSWEEEIQQKEEDLKKQRQQVVHDGTLPPIRGSGQTIGTTKPGSSTTPANQQNKPSQKQKASLPRDYKAWDKFDVDKELEKMDQDQGVKVDSKNITQNLTKVNKLQKEMNTSDMSDEEKSRKAEREKDKGNEAFKANDYLEAEVYYTRSISIVPSAAAYNNRALAKLRLEKWQDAVDDTNVVLEMEPGNLKALLRRAMGRKGLGQREEAIADLTIVLEQEPHNPKAKAMLKEVQDQKATEKSEEAKKSEELLKNIQETTSTEGSKGKGRRMVIEEVDGVMDVEGGDTESEEEADDAQDEGNEDTSKPAENLQEEKKVEETSAEAITETTTTAAEQTSSKEAQEETKNPEGTEKPSSTEETAVTNGEENVAPPAPAPSPPPPLPDGVVQLKDAGNALYQQGQYAAAMKKYTQAITDLEKEEADHSQGLSTLYSNRAASKNKVGDVKGCLDDCDHALQLQPHSWKPLLRRATAYEHLEKFRQAYVDYKHVLNIDPANIQAQQGSHRSAQMLKDLDGPDWRSKLPSIPTYSPHSANRTVSPATPPPTNQKPEPSKPVANEIKAPEAKQPLVNGVKEPSAQEGKASKSNKEKENAEKSTSKKAESSKKAQETKKEKVEEKKEDKKKTPTKSEKKQAKSTSPRDTFLHFKEKGNTLVKKGHFGPATQCYNKCIELSPDQAVAYCNRALCHLKMTRPTEAEADCNKTLELDDKNIKAYFRRAQARKMLKRYSEAAKDLTELLKLDPKNKAAKTELDDVKELWRKELRSLQDGKDKDSGKAAKDAGKSRRRVVVEEGEDSDSEEETTAEGIKGDPMAPKEGPKATSPSTKRKLKAKVEEASRQAKSSPYLFMTAWSALKNSDDNELYLGLLKSIAPEELPKVVSNKMDAEMINKIVHVLKEEDVVNREPALVYQYVYYITKVNRFNMLKTFLSAKDKNYICSTLNCLLNQPCTEYTKDDITALKKAFVF